MSVIQKHNLEDMPTTICTMGTKLNQIENLLRIWDVMSTNERTDCLERTVTVYTEKVVDGRQFCSVFYMFDLDVFQAVLGTDTYVPTICVQSALILARQTIA